MWNDPFCITSAFTFAISTTAIEYDKLATVAGSNQSLEDVKY